MSGNPHGGGTLNARVAVLTVSDTRTEATDRSGDLASEILAAAGHAVVRRAIVPDEPARVRDVVTGWLSDPDCDAIVVNGGTGIAARDRTYEAIQGLLEQRLDGFGEVFRAMSYHEVGPATILSRAVGGVASGKPLFSVPGSPAAVELAVRRLIAPVLSHLVSELRKR